LMRVLHCHMKPLCSERIREFLFESVYFADWPTPPDPLYTMA